MSQNSVDLTYMLGAVQTLWKLLVLRHNGITVLFSELMVVYQGKKCICGRDLLPNFCSDSITSSAWLILDVKVWCINFFCLNYSLTVRTRDSGSVVILSLKKKKKKSWICFCICRFFNPKGRNPTLCMGRFESPSRVKPIYFGLSLLWSQKDCISAFWHINYFRNCLFCVTFSD